MNLNVFRTREVIIPITFIIIPIEIVVSVLLAHTLMIVRHKKT